MTELSEQDRFKDGPTITLDLPTVKLLRMKAKQQGNKDTTFVIRGLEEVGTSIEVVDSEEDVEKMFSNSSKELGIVASGIVRAPENVKALTDKYIRIGCSPTVAAIYGANCPQPDDLDSSLLQKVDELSGKQAPRLIVGKYGDSAIINPFFVNRSLLDRLNYLHQTARAGEDIRMRLPISASPRRLVDEGFFTPGTVVVYDVKVEVGGQVVFSGSVGDANFFVQALQQDR